MIPLPVPHELQNLTQIEEMLIARALPIMTLPIQDIVLIYHKMLQNLQHLCQDTPKTWLSLLSKLNVETIPSKM